MDTALIADPWPTTAPACIAVNAALRAVIEAARGIPALDDTVQVMTPLPVPDPPLVMVSQDAEGTAAHEQDWSATVTLMEPESPAAGLL